MTMQTIYFKDQEGSDHSNHIGKVAPIQSVPWWSAIGSQTVYGESFGQLKSISMEHSNSGNQLNFIKFQGQGTRQGMDKVGDTTQFTIFSDNSKSIGDGQKNRLQCAIPEYPTRFELGFGQPMICAKYPYADGCYGVISAYGSQAKGRIMLPLNLTTDDGPIYVNAKQYHGIIRRRQSRAKAEFEKKMTRARKPYMHESRHLHAMRRPRGCGGRFLNKKNLEIETGGPQTKNNREEQQLSHWHQDSEVLQFDSGSLSPKDANGCGSTISGSEVTSIYSREYIENFSFNCLRSNMKENGHGIVMPSKWVAAAGDSCCNLGI